MNIVPPAAVHRQTGPTDVDNGLPACRLRYNQAGGGGGVSGEPGHTYPIIRGESQTFSTNMAMFHAERSLGRGRFGFRTMV
ncbi:MAG: hypothetical protein L0Y54_24080, partial [Sporichthyaceae bacterium]|nr:hypothetical protein [Sporichthyaceae bacterium]